jgi:hypothetical protein
MHIDGNVLAVESLLEVRNMGWFFVRVVEVKHNIASSPFKRVEGSVIRCRSDVHVTCSDLTKWPIRSHVVALSAAHHY